MGRGLVEPVDDMEREAWHPDLLDWLAEDFVAGGYNAQALLERILTSDAYQRAAVDLPDRVEAYTFQGPAIRRLTAEQFVDALGAVTGVWQAAPAGDFDFTVAGTDGAPAARGRWIQAPRARARSRANGRVPRRTAVRRVALQQASGGRVRIPAGLLRPRLAAGPSEGTTGAQSPWFARGRFSLDVQPATAHVLVGADRPYVLYVNGEKVTDQKKPSAARLIDIGAHVQRGDNVIAVAIGLPAEDADESPAPAAAASDGLFTQVLIRRRLAASAPIETAALSRRAWRVSPTATDGWERPAFDDAGLDARVRTSRQDRRLGRLAHRDCPRARDRRPRRAHARRAHRRRSAHDGAGATLARAGGHQPFHASHDAAGARVAERRHAGGVHRARGR